VINQNATRISRCACDADQRNRGLEVREWLHQSRLCARLQRRHRSGRPRWNGFAQGNEWYSTDEPGGLSAPGGQNNPRPNLVLSDERAECDEYIQISIDNGNSSSGTIPYGSEDFSADA